MTSKWISRLTILVALASSGCKDDGNAADAGTETDTDPLGSATYGSFGSTLGTPVSTSTQGGNTATNPTQAGESDPEPTSDGSAASDPEPTSGEDPSAGDESGGDTDTSTPAGASLEDIIAVLCEWEFDCCSTGEIDFRLGRFTSNAADCTERHIEQLYSNDDVAPAAGPTGWLETLAYDIRLDRTRPNEDAIAECLEVLRDNTCNPVPLGWGYAGAPVACEPGEGENPCDLTRLFTGIQQVGEPCSERMAGVDIECADGSSCEERDGEFICVDKGLEGDFCERDEACDQALYCDFDSGRCAPRADAGEPCSFEDPDDPQPLSESVPCRAGLTCTPDIDSPHAGTCTAFCSEGFDCADDAQCPEGLSCVPVPIGGNDFNYCLPRGSSESARCDSDGDCVDGMYCNDNRCADLNAYSEPCTTNASCQEGHVCRQRYDGSFACDPMTDINEQCDPAAGPDVCAPEAIGCINNRCSTEFAANGDECDPAAITRAPGNQYCFSGVCENTGGETPVCVPGLDAGRDCAPTDETDEAELCAMGLFCNDDGVCERRREPGERCDPAIPEHCLNSHCVEAWDGDHYCSDLPRSPTENTCDGVD